ncbi:MAG: YlxM family DNA-binding protein [Cellulosilyticaceae bacterium]
MEKFLEVTYLFDFYQELLTDKQRELVIGYYFDDLSLGELASQNQISRQSVFDTIKKAEQKFLDYENKLCMWKKHQEQEKILEHMKEIVQQLRVNIIDGQAPKIDELETLIQQLSSEV